MVIAADNDEAATDQAEQCSMAFVPNCGTENVWSCGSPKSKGNFQRQRATGGGGPLLSMDFDEPARQDFQQVP